MSTIPSIIIRGIAAFELFQTALGPTTRDFSDVFLEMVGVTISGISLMFGTEILAANAMKNVAWLLVLPPLIIACVIVFFTASIVSKTKKARQRFNITNFKNTNKSM